MVDSIGNRMALLTWLLLSRRVIDGLSFTLFFKPMDGSNSLT